MENNNKIVEIIKSEITQFPNNCYLTNDTVQYKLQQAGWNKFLEPHSGFSNSTML